MESLSTEIHPTIAADVAGMTEGTTFDDYLVPLFAGGHMFANLHDDSRNFMSKRFPILGLRLSNMHVCATDTAGFDLDKDLCVIGVGNLYLFNPELERGFYLYKFHYEINLQIRELQCPFFNK